MRRPLHHALSILTLAVLIAGSVQSALAGQGRSRPSGGATGARASGSAQTRSTGYRGSSGGSVATRPSGSGSYHGGGARASGSAGYGYAGYRGHGGWYQPGWGWGWGWGWPGWGWGWGWGWPYWGGYYYAQPRTVFTSGRGVEPPGVVVTQIEPKKATVSIDGKPVGQARDYNGKWDQLYVPPGDHTLRLSRNGYMDLELYVRVPSGGTIVVDEQLEKGSGLDPRSSRAPDPPPQRATASPPAEPRRTTAAPPGGTLRSGMLTIRAAPPDAAVYLDGEFLASAAELSRLHGSLPVAQGDHTVQVVRPGFVGRQERVVVEEGPARVFIELEPE